MEAINAVSSPQTNAAVRPSGWSGGCGCISSRKGLAWPMKPAPPRFPTVRPTTALLAWLWPPRAGLPPRRFGNSGGGSQPTTCARASSPPATKNQEKPRAPQRQPKVFRDASAPGRGAGPQAGVPRERHRRQRGSHHENGRPGSRRPAPPPLAIPGWRSAPSGWPWNGRSLGRSPANMARTKRWPKAQRKQRSGPLRKPKPRGARLWNTPSPS